MSYILKHNETYKTLNDYLLNESIIPIPTDYGINKNRDDKNIIEFDGFIISFFKQRNLYYVVGLDTTSGEVGFGVSDEDTFDTDQYDDSRFLTNSPIKVFGKVFYVLSEIIKKSNTDIVQFDSANFSLGKIYDKLVKNKYFLNSLETQGFIYSGNIEGKYIFKKIDT
jgi:hypothetical protein